MVMSEPSDVNVFLLVVVCWPYLIRSADVASALGISTSTVSDPFPFALLSLLKIKDMRLELHLLDPGKIGRTGTKQSNLRVCPSHQCYPIGVSTETSRTGSWLYDAEGMSKYPPLDSPCLHEAHTGQRGGLLKHSLNSGRADMPLTERVVLLVLTSETTVTVSDLSPSFCLSALCDTSIVVSEIDSIWEEFFPGSSKELGPPCSSWRN